MKKAIKIALTTMVIMCMMLGGMHWFKSHQEEKRLIRQDQERIAQYILDNVELVDGNEIKKVKFLQFDKNISTQTWRATVELNSKYDVSLTENYIGGELRFSGFYEEEMKIRANENKSKSIKEIKIEYIKG